VAQGSIAFSVGISTAINWVRRFRETGSVLPGQMGGHKPKAIVGEHRAWLLLRLKQQDFTLRGLVAEPPNAVSRSMTGRSGTSSTPELQKNAFCPARKSGLTSRASGRGGRRIKDGSTPGALSASTRPGRNPTWHRSGAGLGAGGGARPAWPCMDAPFDARGKFERRKRVIGCGHVSGLGCGRISPRPVWDSRVGSTSWERARSAARTPGSPDPVSPTLRPTVGPSPLSHRQRPRTRSLLSRHGGSSINFSSPHQRPSEARCLVRQSHDPPHRWLAGKPPRQPGAGRRALALRPAPPKTLGSKAAAGFARPGARDVRFSAFRRSLSGKASSRSRRRPDLKGSGGASAAPWR